MSRKDKVLILEDKNNDLMGTLVFNKIKKDHEYNILFHNNIIKIILDNRNHKIVNCYGNTYKVINIEETDLDK